MRKVYRIIRFLSGLVMTTLVIELAGMLYAGVFEHLPIPFIIIMIASLIAAYECLFGDHN